MRLLPILLIALLFAGCAQQAQSPAAPGQNQPAPPAQGPNAPSQNASAPAQPSAPAQQVPSIPYNNFSFYSSGWQIYGTEYPSSDNSPSVAVILVPGLGEDRWAYPAAFIERIHTNLPNALVVAIDSRGSGQSTNLGTYQSFSTSNFKDMRSDIVDLGTKYLAVNHPSLKQYYVVGASIGSTAAIMAAPMEHRIVKIAMLSPGIAYQSVDITDTIPDYKQPLFVAYTPGDSYSAQSANQIAGIASELQLTTKSYAGSAHGTGMFASTDNSTPSLSDDLIDFLKKP